MSSENIDWQIQKICTDIDNYELIVEKQKSHWECDQRRESWKWIVSYHGTIVASGSVNSIEQAKILAQKNTPAQ